MAWQTLQTQTQLTSITTEQFFTTNITLNPGESVHCQVDVDFPTTPTDDALVALYGTLDDATENWDDSPFIEMRIANVPDPHGISFIVAGVYKFRVGVRRSGTTDTITSADMKYRKNGVNL